MALYGRPYDELDPSRKAWVTIRRSDKKYAPFLKEKGVLQTSAAGAGSAGALAAWRARERQPHGPS